ncbi:LysE family transporter [Fulvivirgaceae bacterium BMA10]|uniref:LysE family transporter n=1 Tax=Splendidivirga corallicola TaxID=3051826 RepID=A0ABT8KT82_9BACT|nr:LysE family transporter [Fulvivirgaceae bacterium BMA10]
MDILQVFIVGLFFSFLGSIPPGTINISVMQLSLNGQRSSAISFGLGAAFVEFFYAAFAVWLQLFLVSKMDFTITFKVIAAMAMFALGVINLISKKKKLPEQDRDSKRKGFMKGVVISIFNPLAIPFWIAVTTYLQSQNWLALSKGTFWFYILGISSGTFLLLALLAIIISRLSFSFQNNFIVNKITGFIFLGLGFYTIMDIFS